MILSILFNLAVAHQDIAHLVSAHLRVDCSYVLKQ